MALPTCYGAQGLRGLWGDPGCESSIHLALEMFSTRREENPSPFGSPHFPRRADLALFPGSLLPARTALADKASPTPPPSRCRSPEKH